MRGLVAVRGPPLKRYRLESVTRVNLDSGRTGKHAAVGVAENAAVQLAKLGGRLGWSPVAERGLGTFHVDDDRQPVRRVSPGWSPTRARRVTVPG